VDQIFREANIQPNGTVKYEEFVKIVCAPVPDYY
jgi:calmodulin